MQKILPKSVNAVLTKRLDLRKQTLGSARSKSERTSLPERGEEETHEEEA